MKLVVIDLRKFEVKRAEEHYHILYACSSGAHQWVQHGIILDGKF
jgi:hypothetical protein